MQLPFTKKNQEAVASPEGSSKKKDKLKKKSKSKNLVTPETSQEQQDVPDIEAITSSNTKSGDSTPTAGTTNERNVIEDISTTSEDVIHHRVAYKAAKQALVPDVGDSPLPKTAEPTFKEVDSYRGSEVRLQEEEKMRLKAQADEAVHQEYLRIESELTEYQRRIEEFKKANNELRCDIEKNQEEGNREAKELENRRQILKANRAFTTVESSRDAQSLIQDFEDLNASIGDFAHGVLCGLDVAAEQQILEHRHYSLVKAALQDSNVATGLTQMSKFGELTPLDVVDPLVRYVVCADLWTTIFRTFAPGMSEADNERLRTLYKDITADQTQERCGNWRSITYQHGSASADDSFVQKATINCITTLSKLLGALVDGDGAILSEKYYHSALKVFQAALAVQRKAKTEYLSVDYDVYLQAPNTKFDKKLSEESQGGEKSPTEIWLTIGLGVSATRNCPIKNGQIKREKSYPIKALVICDNWDPNV